jgi:hypothetical protein
VVVAAEEEEVGYGVWRTEDRESGGVQSRQLLQRKRRRRRKKKRRQRVGEEEVP